MKKWVMANGFLPFPLLALASAALPWVAPSDTRERHALAILLGFGWLLWLAWLGIAPIPHLRYLWPALAAFAVVLGLGLAALSESARRSGRRAAGAAALAVGLACLFTGCASTLRNLLVGESSFVIWEWRELIPLASIDPARARAQQEMAEHLRRMPVQRRIGVLGVGLELELLAGRPLPPLHQYATVWNSERMPTHVLTTPHLGRLVHVAPEATLWLRENCRPAVHFGGYALCRVTGEYPPDPALFAQYPWRPGP
jgi:hypothetical protein